MLPFRTAICVEQGLPTLVLVSHSICQFLVLPWTSLITTQLTLLTWFLWIKVGSENKCHHTLQLSRTRVAYPYCRELSRVVILLRGVWIHMDGSGKKQWFHHMNTEFQNKHWWRRKSRLSELTVVRGFIPITKPGSNWFEWTGWTEKESNWSEAGLTKPCWSFLLRRPEPDWSECNAATEEVLSSSLRREHESGCVLVNAFLCISFQITLWDEDGLNCRLLESGMDCRLALLVCSSV